MNSLLFVLLMLFAIALHEFGHFITAKKFGMKVEKFFVGFGPRLWSTTRGETEYGFNWIPAGGYVRIAGMNPFEEIPEEEKARTFKAKKPWQRAIVLSAGSATHFLLAIIVLAFLIMFSGIDRATLTVEDVSAGSPAAAASLREGERIVAIDGEPAESWEQVRDYIRSRPGRSVRLTLLLPDGKRRDATATLSPTNPDGERVGFLGVQPGVETYKPAPHKAAWEAVRFTGVASWQSLTELKRILSPSTFAHMFRVISGDEERRINDPASVVGITQVAGEAGFAGLMYLFVGFNIFVGVANMLPLPPLDGGHVAVLAYEKIRRREVDMRKLIPVTATVIAVLVGLFVMSLYLDIVQPLPEIVR